MVFNNIMQVSEELPSDLKVQTFGYFVLIDLESESEDMPLCTKLYSTINLHFYLLYRQLLLTCVKVTLLLYASPYWTSGHSINNLLGYSVILMFYFHFIHYAYIKERLL
jgi:hypothetical protein